MWWISGSDPKKYTGDALTNYKALVKIGGNIIELKDKILKIYDLEELSTPLDNTNKEEALSALEVLGFARKQSEKMVEKILKASPSLSVEDIIKQTLKGL